MNVFDWKYLKEGPDEWKVLVSKDITIIYEVNMELLQLHMFSKTIDNKHMFWYS